MTTDFPTAWAESLRTWTAAHLEGIAIPAEARDFLLSVGLPASAGPFLSFRPHEPETAAKALDLDDDDAANALWIIGRTGGGDPICVGPDGHVYVVSTSDIEFRRMNSSLPQLAASLLAYRDYVAGGWADKLINDGAVDQGKAQLAAIAGKLRAIDPEAYEGFWEHDLAAVLTRVRNVTHELGLELADIVKGQAKTA